jgi:hypothetical protein
LLSLSGNRLDLQQPFTVGTRLAASRSVTFTIEIGDLHPRSATRQTIGDNQIVDADDEMIRSTRRGSPGCRKPTVTGDINAAQSIVSSVKHKKIYCKTTTYQ